MNFELPRSKITIFQYADFNSKYGAYQRIRRKIAENIDHNKFETIAFGSKNLHVQGTKLVDLTKPPRFVSMLSFGVRPIGYVFKLPTSASLTHPNLTIFDLFRCLNRETVFSSIDIFHSVNWDICLRVYKMLKRKNQRIKHVLTSHLFPLDPINCNKTKRIAKNADVVTAVSNYVKTDIERFCDVSCEVIPDGVDTKFFAPITHKNIRLKVLYVGSLMERKRPQYVALMAKNFPQCDFIIHGKGAMTPFLQHFKQQNGLKNLTVENSRLSSIGLKDLYAMADIFMFPSIHEGLPNVVLEAMASGLPILASDASFHKELVENGSSGFLCNNIEEFKKHLTVLVNDECLRKRMGIQSREIALRFDWSNIIPKWEELYERVASR